MLVTQVWIVLVTLWRHRQEESPGFAEYALDLVRNPVSKKQSGEQLRKTINNDFWFPHGNTHTHTRTENDGKASIKPFK